ncbi:unnamed protein product [Parascedosporium putredinis]|uniref:DUF1749-domain-containing protein n=1 Tax=Parascedosporium putredinis TaxID=1442378 RepID=A0A9P1MCX2_9PEZI|nr:unnamed protein product [Parascedosporium putredinis]CAI8002436.1 unnamed protein product [Parascedosporium putredinis]
MASNKPAPFLTRVHYYDSPTRNTTADGPHTIPALTKIAARLDPANGGPGYSIVEFRMRSSYVGYGTSSLTEDVAHITALVKYLRSIGKSKIVLCGHSTGTQDIMEYVNSGAQDSQPVDGFVLQGPVSDRQSIELLGQMFPDHDFADTLACAEQYIAEGRKNDCLPTAKLPPIFAGDPISAYRYHSLATKDLSDEFVNRVWGRFAKPILVLHCADDEFVPPHVDKAALVDRWAKATSHMSPLSGVLPNANHTLDSDEAIQGVKTGDDELMFVSPAQGWHSN